MSNDNNVSDKNDNDSKKTKNSPPERMYVHEIIDEKSGITIRIQKTDVFRPYYNLVIGRLIDHENGETFTKFLPVRVKTHLAKVQEIEDPTKIISELTKQAVHWIVDRCQEREDQIIEEKQQRESKQLEREKGTSRPGLKTLGKINRTVLDNDK